MILTTFWDQVATEEEGVEREEQLESNFFKDLVQGGALFMRHDCTLESAHQVLGHILTLEPVTVQIQEEIRIQSKTLEDPAAGSMHCEEAERLIAKQEEDVAIHHRLAWVARELNQQLNFFFCLRFEH